MKNRTRHLLFGALLLALGLLARPAAAQLTPQNRAQLAVYEDTLASLAATIVLDTVSKNRIRANYLFIPMLTQALQIRHSFDYPFEALENISILYPDDRDFRIFSWQLTFQNKTHRYFGALQMNTKDGTLRLIPFFDFSDTLQTPQTEILTPKNWYGCLYYKMVETRFFGRKYYTLFGWDGNDIFSTRKVMEILTFDRNQLVFGASVILMGEGNHEEVLTRFIIEYRDDANVTLNYNQDMDLVIYDHLSTPDTLLPDLKMLQLPDGSYEGFEWRWGKWRHIPKVFDQQVTQFKKGMMFGNPPVPDPVLDDRD